MKYAIMLLVILFPVLTKAQTDSLIKKIRDSTLVKNVLKDLTETWTLGIDSSSDAVDLRIYNKFKSLFDSSATVEDEFNAFYQYSYDVKTRKISGTYKIIETSKPYDVYAHDIALQVRKLRDSVEILSMKFDNSNAHNTVIVEIKRDVYAEKARQYVLDPESYVSALLESRKDIDFTAEKLTDSVINARLINLIQKQADSAYQFTSSDTLRISIFYDQVLIDDDTVSTYKILRIERLNNLIECKNDADKDAILDFEDSAKNIPGDFTAGGIPDYDLDGVADNEDACFAIYGDAINKGCPQNYFITNNKLDGFIGFQMNSANINLPELNQLGYLEASGNDAVDVLQSKKGVLKNPGLTAGLFAGGSYSYYFGHNKRKNGISVGLTFSAFTAGYELTDPIVYTFKSNDGVDDYRRQITIDSLNEKITYHIFNFPVMYKYRGFIGKSNKKYPSWFSLNAGPSLMLFRTYSDYDANISFGGLYQTDGDQIVYTDLFDNGSTFNFLLTADGINAQNPNPGADEIFRQLKANSASYDFANKKPYEGTRKNLTRLTVAVNLGFDWIIQLRKSLAFQFGAHFIYAPLPERGEKYKPIDKTTDEFQSIYNSTAKSSYSAYGLKVGFSYRF